MKETKKAQIRADRRTMTAVQVARKHGVTRQRVEQIASANPDMAQLQREKEDALPEKGPRPQAFVRFAKAAHRHLNDAELQARICAASGTHMEIARRFGTTHYAVQRIRMEHGVAGPCGRPPRASCEI